jgi:class 3 adenylate cyclase
MSDSAKSAVGVRTVSGMGSSNASILVVDDSDAIRLTMVRTLNALGYANTQIAEDGFMALDLIRQHAFDLVLLDIEMPHLDGFGVLATLKNESFRSEMAIIVTSGVDELDSVVRCIELGAEDFLHKPVNSVLLRARVGASLERKHFRDVERRHFLELQEQKRLLEIEQAKSKHLLLNILPQAIAARLLEGEVDIAERYSDVTILFADIVDFTDLASQTDPQELVELLNHIFSRFDVLTELHGLEKIKTIGDCYMVVGGLPLPRSDHATVVAEMALGMLRAIEEVNQDRNINLGLRIGLNSGPVVAGVIGRKKFTYDLWGNTVNLAGRMESSGVPGRIQIPLGMRELLKESFSLTERGMVDCKGLGAIQTYFLNGKNQ